MADIKDNIKGLRSYPFNMFFVRALRIFPPFCIEKFNFVRKFLRIFILTPSVTHTSQVRIDKMLLVEDGTPFLSEVASPLWRLIQFPFFVSSRLSRYKSFPSPHFLLLLRRATKDTLSLPQMITSPSPKTFFYFAYQLPICFLFPSKNALSLCFIFSSFSVQRVMYCFVTL